jgi:hypothetical protein
VDDQSQRKPKPESQSQTPSQKKWPETAAVMQQGYRRNEGDEQCQCGEKEGRVSFQNK